MLIRVCSLFLLLLWLLQVRVTGDSYLPPPELLVESRIAELDISTPVALDYNEHVLEFITLFSGERREAISRVPGLKSLYFPIIDEIFDNYGLPFEIKYTAIVESALDPLAVSPSGAMGLWQLLVDTARMFDLEISSYIDTFHVSRPLNLKQVSGELEIPLETLRFLNPGYIRDHIPANGISKTLVQEIIIWVSHDNLQFLDPGLPVYIDHQGSSGQ